MDTQVNNNNLTALLYHKILPKQLLDADTISIKKFGNQMNYLHENAFNAVTIGDITNNDNPSDKDIPIAFDDGYENVYKYALPVLKQYNFKATIFLISDYINRYNTWDFHMKGRFKHLNIDQIKELADYGCEFGSHTQTHPNLLKLNDDQLLTELDQSKQKLEELLDTRVDLLSIPFGQCSEKVITAAKRCDYRNIVILWNSHSNGDLRALIKAHAVYPWESNRALLRKLTNSKLELFKNKIYRIGSAGAGLLNSINKKKQ